MIDNTSNPLDEMWNPCIRNGETIPNYEVSNLGRLRRIGGYSNWKGMKPLSFSRTKHGYLQVHLWANNKSRVSYIHRLVAEAFIGPCPSKYQVNHINGDKSDNRVSNLEYLSGVDNMKHATVTGLTTQFRGKLTAENVAQIKKLLNDGVMSGTEIAAKFNVTDSNICCIRKGKSWSNVKAALSE